MQSLSPVLPIPFLNVYDLLNTRLVQPSHLLSGHLTPTPIWLWLESFQDQVFAVYSLLPLGFQSCLLSFILNIQLIFYHFIKKMIELQFLTSGRLALIDIVLGIHNSCKGILKAFLIPQSNCIKIYLRSF